MAGFFQCSEFFIMRGVVFAFGPEIDEEAVVAVSPGLAERLAVDWNQALAFPCRGTRRSVARPGAEVGNLSRRKDRHLVAAFEAGQAHGKP